ncbi:MAG: leucine-rich repeat domain-containing protein [Coprobacillus sp.]|nr:leucine-rich repeat domain-containing protein [Coprobacillus sp.]
MKTKSLKYLTILLIGVSLVGLSGCDNLNPSTHEHTYSDQWSYDDNYHWHAATCGHNVSVVHNPHAYEITTHINPTCAEEGLIVFQCTTCGYIHTEHEYDALGHSYTYAEYVVPTCIEDGYLLFVCTTCEDTYKEIIPATGHNFTGWVVSTQTSCFDSGEETRTCIRCGTIETRDIAPVGEHDWSDWAVVTEASCTTDGLETRTCSRCGASESQAISSLGGHDWGEWVTTTEPSCTVPGEETRTCSQCHEKETNEIAALGHEYTSEITKEANCTYPGEETYTCIRGDGSYTVEIPIDPDAHDWTEHVYTEPTCTEAGTEDRECTICGTSESEHIMDPLGHDYVAEVTTEATCTTVGTLTYTCSRCEDSYTEEIPATGVHLWDEWHVGLEATCTTDGYMERACSTCDETEQGETIPALGHEYTATITKEATCGQDGVMTFTCIRGDDSYTEVIPATGEHIWGDWSVTDPTCLVDGESIRICEVCGETETETSDALGHDYQEKIDGTYHWEECSRCQDVINKQEHQYEGFTTDNYHHYKICTECGYTTEVSNHTYGEDGKCTTCGYEFPYTYILDDTTRECTITGFLSDDEKVVIPSEFLGYQVTTISNASNKTAEGEISPLTGIEHVKSLTIPNSVTTIGIAAFNNGSGACPNLTEVTFQGSGLKDIGATAFQHVNITSLSLPSSVITIGNSAFNCCKISGILVIPDSVEYIGSYAFASNFNLTNVVVGSGVTDLQPNAFCYCYNLAYCTILSTQIEIIRSFTFGYCYALKYINIPDGVETIERRAFASCYSLEYLILPTSLQTIESGAFVNDSNIADVYSYLTDGSLKDSIDIQGDDSGNLESAQWHFYSESEPTEAQRATGYSYWHMSNSTPTVW